MGKLWRIPLMRRLSTKMVAGFIVIMAIFAVLGLLASREISQLRSAEDDALSRADAVQHLQEAKAEVTEQVRAHYELLLENSEDNLAAFDSARQRRDAALAQADSHDLTPQEQEWFARLQQSEQQFDANFLDSVLPAWRSGDQAGALAYEKTSDMLVSSIDNVTALLVDDFQARNNEAQNAAAIAGNDARSYLIIGGLAAFLLSIIVAVVAARRLNRPLAAMKNVSVAMARGDLSRRVQINSYDEIAELGDSFNRMADAVEHKIHQFTRLADIALAITREHEWERVVEIVMEKGKELTDSQAAAIVLYDETAGAFADTYTSGLSSKFVSHMQFRPGGLADEVLQGESAVFSDDLDAQHRLSSLARIEGICAFICLPLKVGQKKLGVFYVYSKKAEAYGREELSVLSILSNQAAIAIHNAQRYRRSEEKAVTDGLTGLYNQRHFYQRLDEEIKRAQRADKPLSIIFCDLDKFKMFNDVNGHALGDQALQDISAILQHSKRGIDIAARYGGEEFAVILPETDSAGAQIIAHRIRRGVAAHEFRTKSLGNTTLSTSVGISSFPQDAGSARELVERADWAMYYGKRQGGNRVTMFRQESDGFGGVSLEDLVREELNLAAAQAMTAAAARPDSYDRHRTESVARLASSIALQLGLDDEAVHQVRVCGLLHDIGLVGVPEEIINKRGRLSADEWAQVKRHPEVGETILRHLQSLQGFLPIVRHHHEHFDGAGYPDGLQTGDIPIGARIIAVADAFQAMTSDRPYRKALTAEQALDELRIAAGTQFDPSVVEAFFLLLHPHRAKAS